MRTASDVLKDHVFSILDDVLLLLSGQGFPTPEKTYKLDGGWGLALSDLRRCFDQHRARIADLEAERDAAKAEAKGRTAMAARTQEALRYIMNGLPANDAVWAAYGNAESARAWLAERDAKMQSDLDAARAGEARAVEALKGASEAGWLPDMEEVIHSVDCTCDFCDQNRLLETIEQVLSDDAQPALDWLDQREREAAVRELEGLMESEWKWEEFELKASIYARLADLRNQQPAACSREEK